MFHYYTALRVMFFRTHWFLNITERGNVESAASESKFAVAMRTLTKIGENMEKNIYLPCIFDICHTPYSQASELNLNALVKVAPPFTSAFNYFTPCKSSVAIKKKKNTISHHQTTIVNSSSSSWPCEDFVKISTLLYVPILNIWKKILTVMKSNANCLII